MKCQNCKSNLNHTAVEKMKSEGKPLLCGFCDGTINGMILRGELPPPAPDSKKIQILLQAMNEKALRKLRRPDWRGQIVLRREVLACR